MIPALEDATGGLAVANERRERAAILRTHDLRRSFGRFRAVDDLSLTVREGEIYGFLGKNGAGKTTTIRMLMGIIKPNRGNIELLGTKTTRATNRQKRHIGYVSQDQHFYPWMTCQRIGTFAAGFYPTWDMAEFQRLLAALDVPPKRKTSELSGGMRVKLALALALAHRPTLLILDEPTSSLDPVARREFLEIIASQATNHGRTTFFSTHRIEEVERVAHTIGIIDNGKLRYEGDIPTLTASIRQVSIATVATQFPPPIPGAPPHLAQTQMQMQMPAFTAPDGFEVLKDRISGNGERTVVLKAEPSRWVQASFGGGTVTSLSLEDAFIAIAGTEVAAV